MPAKPKNILTYLAIFAEVIGLSEKAYEQKELFWSFYYLFSNRVVLF